MIDVLVLAMALTMDTLAVSISLGAKAQGQSRAYLLRLAIYTALYFGVAQGVMPLIGYLLDSVLLGWMAFAAPLIGGAILISLGSIMLYESYKVRLENKKKHGYHGTNIDKSKPAYVKTTPDEATPKAPKVIRHRTMFTLAIGTSIDAMAAGFTLNLLALEAWLVCLIIAMVAALFGWVGVYFGWRSGTWLESKAEVLGGVVLIAMGLRVMLF